MYDKQVVLPLVETTALLRLGCQAVGTLKWGRRVTSLCSLKGITKALCHLLSLILTTLPTGFEGDTETQPQLSVISSVSSDL